MAERRTWNVRTTPRWANMGVWGKKCRVVNPGLFVIGHAPFVMPL